MSKKTGNIKREMSFYTKSGRKRGEKNGREEVEKALYNVLTKNYGVPDYKARTMVSQAYNKDIKYTKSYKKARKKQWTADQLAASLVKDKLKIMLANTGFELEDIRKYMGNAKMSELLDTNNWQGRVFIHPRTGNKYEIKFNVYEDETTLSKVIEGTRSDGTRIL